MADPTGSSRARHQAKRDERRANYQTPEDSLMNEAYGPRGAALRKTAAGMGEGLAKKDEAQRGLVGKVKRFFGGS